ncbi:hypothetical protein [Actinokineospora iranica]|uniref:Uncharacterized protein n=1 Tax=Actinokineospora iranica TaxID=1271860 RepID=A0A1G6VDJ8_9PSEU|nr:hypothetical protein [Actinokineospora iranica]SDD51770.1 hypothetical protein SAMN05216174_11285 [Actinokineospora iranica]
MAELRRWDARWTAVVAGSGQPPITCIEPEPEPESEPESESESGGEPEPSPARGRVRLAVLALASALAGALAATAVAGVWPWTVFDPTPDLRAEVGRPKPGGSAEGCPSRSTDVRDRRDDSAGSLWYRECADHLEFWLTDHMKDGRCVWAVVHWSNGATDTTSRACPAGKVDHDKIPRLTDDYRVELIARTTG